MEQTQRQDYAQDRQQEERQEQCRGHEGGMNNVKDMKGTAESQQAMPSLPLSPSLPPSLSLLRDGGGRGWG